MKHVTDVPGDAVGNDQLLATLADASAGPTYSVSSLANALAARGCPTAALTLEGWRADDAPPAMPDVAVLRFPTSTLPVVSALGASSALRTALGRRMRERDIVHTHGLWLMPNIYPAMVARGGGKARIVHSPRGMLGAEALRYSRWKKRALWHTLQRRALAQADCLHATAESEYREIRAAGLTNPVAIIPNGVDLPPVAPLGKSEAKTVLSLGRLHPKKGLDLLIRAWAELEPTFPEWSLRIVGHDENGHAAVLRALAAATGAVRVSIEPPLHGAAKDDAFRHAGLFVLPSLNENFAMTVAEALAHGVPVISSKGAPWAGLADERCGWWIDRDRQTLRATLAAAMLLPAQERAAMGARGRAWMARDFSWASIAERMDRVYRWLARGEPAPGTVRFD